MATTKLIEQIASPIRAFFKTHPLPDEHPIRAVLIKAGIEPEEKSLPLYSYFTDTPESAWNKFPLGENIDCKEITWDISATPHLLVTGSTGGGKSVVLRNLLFHCLLHPDEFSVFAIDLKRVELSYLKKYKEVVETIAYTSQEAFDTVQTVHSIMMERYAQMEERHVNSYRDLPIREKAIVLFMDEVYGTLGQSSVDTDEDTKLKIDIQRTLIEIAKLGRAAGVHLVLATQRPSIDAIPSALKNNIPARLIAGKVDNVHSQMTLDNDEGTLLPIIRGRGYFQANGVGEQIQLYFAPQDYVDNLRKTQ